MELPFGLPQWIVLAVATQRVAELVLARRNTTRLVARGAVEHGRRHYPLFVLLHGSWLISLFLTIRPDASVHASLLGIFVLMQLARVWVIASLDGFWTTRVITLPNEPLIERGPYRWLKHPNYCIVVVEIAALPLSFGAVQTAVIFSVLNGFLLWWRVRVENRALAARSHETG